MRAWFAVMAFAVGCDDIVGKKEESAPTEPDRQKEERVAKKLLSEGPPDPFGSTFASAKFMCCSSDDAWELVRSYEAMHDGLARDDERRASMAGSALVLIAHKIATGGSSMASYDVAREIEDDVLAVKEAGIARMRDAYPAIGEKVIRFAHAHEGGTHEVARAYCPMKPGAWLQDEHGITNPFYGSKMLTCGEFQK